MENKFDELANVFEEKTAKKVTRASRGMSKSNKGTLYDARTEELIAMALADGVLTEKEKLVLLSNAKEQGINIDELEMVLEARLVQMRNSKPSKANKKREVRKCPVCGDLLDEVTMICPSCGYRFVSKENDFVKKLKAEIESAYNRLESRRKRVQKEIEWNELNLKSREKIEIGNDGHRIIGMLPLPNKIEDCIATLDFCVLKINVIDAGTLLWKEYYDRVLTKLKRESNNDKTLLAVVADFKKKNKKLSIYQKRKIRHLMESECYVKNRMQIENLGNLILYFFSGSIVFGIPLLLFLRWFVNWFIDVFGRFEDWIVRVFNNFWIDIRSCWDYIVDYITDIFNYI